MLRLAPDVATDPWADFLTHGLLGRARLINNADVKISAVRSGAGFAPVVMNRLGRPDCSWVASLRNAYGRYARAETDIVRINRFLQPLWIAASHAAEALLVAGGLAGGNFLHNWLVSTNLHPPDLKVADLLAPVAELCREEPELPVVIRSLTAPLHAELLAELSGIGFLLLPSRQVWIVDDPASGEWRTHRDSRRDLALVEATAGEWTWVTAEDFTDADYARALELYQRLYRQRYPVFNPDYTEAFLRIGVATGFLHLAGLRRTSTAKLSAMLGMVHRQGVSTTPVLGYDLDAPATDGLYRRLTLRALQEGEARGATLHCSSGAGMFKFSRGAKAHVEFSAVWARHLPAYRRANLHVLAQAIQRWAVPYLESHRF